MKNSDFKNTRLYKRLPGMLLLMLLMTIGIMFSSCEGEEDSGGGCEDALVTLSEALSTKSQTYSANPTESNCNAVRTAALNLINKATSCGYGSLYEDQTDFWLSLDCTDGTGGTGGGGGGGGGTGGTSGNAMFWTQSDLGCGTISVTLNGSGGSISSYYSSGAPSCGASGCANFTVPAGTYTFTASCSGQTWDGNITVSAGGCSKMKLTN